MLKVEFDGETYDYDTDSLTMDELDQAFAHTQLGMTGFVRAVSEAAPKPVAAFIYLLRERRGDKESFAELWDAWKAKPGLWQTWKTTVAPGSDGGDAADPTSTRPRRPRGSAPADVDERAATEL